MKVIVRRRAADDLDYLFQWIAKDNSRAAANMVGRLRDRINTLEMKSLARMGRVGFVEGTLELVEPPYIIVYSIDDVRGEVTILSIVHSACDPKNRLG